MNSLEEVQAEKLKVGKKVCDKKLLILFPSSPPVPIPEGNCGWAGFYVTLHKYDLKNCGVNTQNHMDTWGNCWGRGQVISLTL